MNDYIRILKINLYKYTFSFFPHSECPSESGKTSVHDVHIINLSLPHEIKVLADKKEAAPDPSSLNINRVSWSINVEMPN